MTGVTREHSAAETFSDEHSDDSDCESKNRIKVCYTADDRGYARGKRRHSYEQDDKADTRNEFKTHCNNDRTSGETVRKYVRWRNDHTVSETGSETGSLHRRSKNKSSRHRYKTKSHKRSHSRYERHDPNSEGDERRGKKKATHGRRNHNLLDSDDLSD